MAASFLHERNPAELSSVLLAGQEVKLAFRSAFVLLINPGTIVTRNYHYG